ncbi:MAG TPA: PQQ-binding-like beta-propeller repeat protein [Thermoanaerobaculia bacterium]|nr:PQQ-binding-like beta-propeller repeat protein [Thermoanaerobaculia bacterium]
MSARRRLLATGACLLGLLLGMAASAGELEEQLWAAARRGDAAAVRSLLARGAEVDAPFRAGGTALLFAAQKGHREVVEALLAAGANVHAREEVNGWGVLLWASFGGHCELLPLLLERGADPNLRDLSKGLTPLALAVARGSRPCAEALLVAPSLSRETLAEAAALAAKAGRKELLALIEKRQAELVAPSPVPAAEAPPVPSWPQFRGPFASGVAAGEPPTEWSLEPGRGLRWKTAIPGVGHASPIVWGDRVFVATAVTAGGDPAIRDTGNPMDSVKETRPTAWKLLCLDARTGEILWERTAAEGVPTVGRHPKNSLASATPSTDGQRVVAWFGERGLFAWDLDGRLLWQRDLGSGDAGFFYDPELQWGSASSPILFDGLVIVQVDVQKGSYLAAFRAEDGAPAWRVERDELPSWGTPTIYRDGAQSELVTNATNAVRAYDPHTGRELWSLRTANSYVSAATPVAEPGLIVVGNGYRPARPLYAIRPGSRGDISLPEGQPANQSVVWSTLSGGPYYTTPLLHEGLLYVLSEDGVLAVYRSASGEPVYRQRVGSGERFSASPVLSGGRLYLASEDGEVFVVAAGPSYRLLATNPVGEPCLATPALVGNTLYLRARSHLFAFGPPTAEPRP